MSNKNDKKVTIEETEIDITKLHGVTEAPKGIPENTSGKLKVITEC